MNEEKQKLPNELSGLEAEAGTQTTNLQLDDITKAIAFTVGVLYVTGILAINTYLYSLGIADFSLLEARYVYTGFLALAPILLSILAPSMGIHYFRYLPIMRASVSTSSFQSAFINLSASPLMSWVWLLVGILSPFILLFVFATQDSGVTIESVGIALWMYLLCYGAGMFGMMTFAAFLPELEARRFMEILFPSNRQKNPSEVKLSKENAPPNLITAFALALFCIGYFAGYLSQFDDHILTKVPEQFGGAKPHQAQILFHSDAIDGARELGIEIPDKNAVSKEVTILFEGESIIVVRLSNEHVIQLSKEMIQAVEIEFSVD